MMKHFLTASLQQGLGTVVNRSSYLLPLQRKYIISLFRDTKPNLSMAAEWKHISYIKWDVWTFLSPSLWHLYHENLFAGSGETLFSSSFSSASHLSAHKTACGEFTRWERSEITALPTPTLTPARQAMKERSVRYTLFGTPGWTSFFCPSCFKSSWLRFNKELETFLRAFGPRWLDSIMLAQIYRPHPWECPIPSHPGAVTGLRSVETVWGQWTQVHVWDALSWDMEHYPDGRSITRWFTWWAATLRLAVGFKWCSDGTKGPKVCPKRIPHTIRRVNCW